MSETPNGTVSHDARRLLDAINDGPCDRLSLIFDALAAAEERGRRAGIEERDRLRDAVGQLANEANTCRHCGDWFYTPDGLIPRSSCDYCKPLRGLLPPWHDVVRGPIAPRDSGPVCDCQLRIGDHHLATCATQKPRDSGKDTAHG